MINKVQDSPYIQNYSTHNTKLSAQKNMGKSCNVSFGAAKGLPPEIIEALGKNSKWWEKFLCYAGEHQGEALNILVTAVGTAIICPLFIRYNPFSKEDKDTRAYSAWRQPISAVIAVLTQLTITKWFNNWMAKTASTSDKNGNAVFTRADLRAKPHERYLKRIIKLEHPEFNDKQVAEMVKIRQIDAEKRVIAAKRVEYKDKKVSINDMMCQDTLDKAKEDLYKNLTEECEAEIKTQFGKSSEDLSSAKLNKFLKEKLETKAKAQNMTSAELIRKTAEKNIEKEVIGETVLKTYIRRLKNSGKTLDEAIKLCTEGDLNSYIQECIKDNKHLAEKFSGLSSEEIAKDAIKKLQYVKEYESAKKLGEFTSIRDLGKSFNEILHNVKIKKMVRAKTKDAQKIFKLNNTQLGLIVTLLTLPISCGILNWAYPRIMEKIMPEMAAKKKQTSGQVKKDGGDK